MSVEFPVHGQCEIEIEGELIVLTAFGPWNIEFFHAFHAALVDKVSDIRHGQHAVLLKPRGQAVTTRECLDLHCEFLKNVSTVAIAVDLSGCDTKPITKALLESIYKRAGVKFSIFENESLAKAWLKEELK